MVEIQPRHARDVVSTSVGDIVATDVQAAIEELDTEKVGPATTDTLTNKSIDGDNNTITNLPTSSLGDTIREGQCLDLAQAIFDRCTDPRLIMVADQEPGAELVTNGKDWTGATGATPPTGWSISAAGVFSIIADNGPSGTGDSSLKIEVNATPTVNPSTKQYKTVVIGNEYTIGFWFKHGDATKGVVKIGSIDGGEDYKRYDITDVNWTYYQHTVVATTTLLSILIMTVSGTTGQYEEYDNITCTLTCKDYSGKSHDGIFQGAMTSGDRVDQGSVFMYDPDGSDDYIDFGDDDDFSFDDSGAAPFTIGVVIEVVDLSGTKSLIAKWDTGNTLREWELSISSSEIVYMYLYDESVDIVPYVNTSVLTIGDYYFIIVTYDGVGGNDADDGLNIYINGVLDNATKSGTVGYTAMEPSTTALTLGCDLSNGVPLNLYPGDIGALFLDGSEWSAADVWSLWLQLKGKYGL